MASALLIIDVQVGILAGMAGYRFDAVVATIAALRERARSAGVPVFYVQHDGAVGHRLETGRAGWEIVASLRPAAGEPVVHKRNADAFGGTTLEEELRRRDVTQLIVTGCMTEYCIDTTCRAATAHGYDVTLVADAHTTADTEILPAAKIVAHHNSILDGLGTVEHEIVVRPSNEVRFEAAAAQS